MAFNSFSLFLPSFIDLLLDSGWSLWLFGRREITGQLMKKSLALLDLTLIFLSKYMKVMKPIDLIVKLYVKALLIKTCYNRISTNDTKNERGRRLLEEGESLLKSIDLLKSLRSYFWSYCKNNCALPKACTEEYKEDYMISCFKALKFFYLLLAEAVKSEKIDKDTVPQDVFYTYCDAFKSLHSCTFKEDGGGVMVFDVALAAFSLSIASSSTMKQSAHVIKDVVREWNNPQGILYLSDVLYNIGLHLRRNNQVQQAFKAMKLCCRASRKHVLLLFKLVDTKTGVDLKRYVEKMCYNSSQLLHFLNYLGCQNAKLQREIVRSLETWSDAGRQFSMLSVPVMLVKVWVKITVVKNRGVKDGSAQTISNLLIFSKQATKRTREIILEQELGAYEEFYDIGPEFCDIMILEIFKILKEDLTTTEDGCFLLIGKKSTQNKCLQESRILLRIGLVFRAKGMDHYIWYLSEAIIKMDGATCSGGTPLCHQLAVAYCLRAICSLEAKPYSKQVTQDINAAVKRWTSILITAPSELDDIFTEIIRLLCYIVDLLSLKGFLKSLPVTYERMIKLFKWNSIPLEKCLAILYESRRLSHALCVSPLSEAFIEKLAEVHCGRSFMSVDYWRKELQLCLDGFKQTLSFRIDDAEKVPQSPRSAFMDGYLCYDLCQKLILNGHLSGMFFPNFSHLSPSRNQIPICLPRRSLLPPRSRQPPNPAHNLVNLFTVSTSSTSSPSRSLRELLLIQISGDDEFGYMLADILKQNNVNTSGVRYDSNARTALAFVTLRADGEREFLFFVIQVLICFFKNQNLIKTSLSSSVYGSVQEGIGSN